MQPPSEIHIAKRNTEQRAIQNGMPTARNRILHLPMVIYPDVSGNTFIGAGHELASGIVTAPNCNPNREKKKNDTQEKPHYRIFLIDV